MLGLNRYLGRAQFSRAPLSIDVNDVDPAYQDDRDRMSGPRLTKWGTLIGAG